MSEYLRGLDTFGGFLTSFDIGDNCDYSFTLLLE